MKQTGSFNFDLAQLEHLLNEFSQRPRAQEGAATLGECLCALQKQGLDKLPLPATGNTLLRWRILARVAAADLGLAKLYEGHTDALAILHECNASSLTDDGLWGIWAAEPPDARTCISAREGERVYLKGRKAWCSGALQVTHALVTVWDENKQQQLVALTLNEPNLQFTQDDWQAIGMGATESIELEFDHTPAASIGKPGEYISRAGFWHGGGGIAACWYGAAEALAEYLREHCSRRPSDAHANAHLGAVDSSLGGAAAALRECAAWIDEKPRQDAARRVRMLRALVEQAATQVATHVGRALGATPYCRNRHFARLSADLPVFMRQSHAERDLAELGQVLANHPAGGWRL